MPEGDRQIALNSDLGQKLLPVGRRFIFEGGLKQRKFEADLDGLPLINQDTHTTLGARLNLLPDLGVNSEQPFWRGINLSNTVFRSIRRDGNGNGKFFLENVQHRLGKNSSKDGSLDMIGMGIVIESFHTQNSDLLNRIQRVKRVDISKAFEDLDDVKLPSYQMFLIDIVERMSFECNSDRVYQGAAAMYKVLETLHMFGHLQY